MTGINIPATDVTLPGLRNLSNWSALESKLPQTTSGLLGMVEGELPIQLNAKESKVWEFANGMVPIADIAKKLDLSIELARRTAFCLTVAGLAEEVPMLSPSRKAAVNEDDKPLINKPMDAPSSAFLDKMMGFLKQQAELQTTHKQSSP
jgi:hypothetical protein